MIFVISIQDYIRTIFKKKKSSENWNISSGWDPSTILLVQYFINPGGAKTKVGLGWVWTQNDYHKKFIVTNKWL